MKSYKRQRGQKGWEKGQKYMRAKIHLPRSSFLSERHESSKLTGRKNMKGKGVEMGKVNVMWERERQRETQ